MEVTATSTLAQVLMQPGMAKMEPLLNPLYGWSLDVIPDPEIRAQIRSNMGGRDFLDIPLRDTVNVFPSLNVPSVLEGLKLLTHRASEGCTVFNIGENVQLSAFPAQRGARMALICPGGGYSFVCALTEGYPVAKRLNDLGITAFVLHYRTGTAAHHPGPLADVARALERINAHADKFGVDTNQYALFGFSAGGHLAASFGVEQLGFGRFNAPKPGTIILGYPVITMRDWEYTHIGSRKVFLGEDVDSAELQNLYSVEQQISTDYPPTYVWHCDRDPDVPVQNARVLADALRKYGVPNLYEEVSGNFHGWGVGDGTPAQGWIQRAVDFWKELRNEGRT